MNVTVLLPVYNGGEFLAESIRHILNQSFPHLELLIIDDGSTDDSVAQAGQFKDPRLRVLRNERNLGLVPTLNRGLAESRFDWIARCDADDLWQPDKLARQCALCLENPSLALVGSDAILVGKKGSFRGRFRTVPDHASIRWDLCFRNAFIHSSVLFRKDVALGELGGYRPIPAAEDYDLWSRIAAHHPVANLREPLLRYRQHDASIMAQENASGLRSSRAALRQIMEDNLRDFAAVSSSLPSLLAQLDTWLEPAGHDLAAFWQAYDRVWQDCHRPSAVGEHALNLFYRQRRVSRRAALQCLRSFTAAQLRALPWPKIALQLAAP